MVAMVSFSTTADAKQDDGKAKNLTTGRLSPTSGLYWKDLSVQTVGGTVILHPTQGFVSNGHVCGLLGPSGSGTLNMGTVSNMFVGRKRMWIRLSHVRSRNAPLLSQSYDSTLLFIPFSLYIGKTTFLSSLGGTLASSSNSGLHASGQVWYHHSESQQHQQQSLSTSWNETLHVAGGNVAWLQQRDVFFNMLTVRETLELAAFLELPHFTSRQRSRRVQTTLDALGLTKLQLRRIGNSFQNNGLSGGEQRRLSLALELISSPKLFIGDEPTSGLVCVDVLCFVFAFAFLLILVLVL